MFDIHHLTRGLLDNWPIWVVTLTLIVAAVIDGLQLKVPNWITFPMIISGWVYSVVLSPYAGWEGLMYSVLGTIVGLALLLPAYAIGGMGAGDVKLLAGVGAWVWSTDDALCVRRLDDRRRHHRDPDGAVPHASGASITPSSG